MGFLALLRRLMDCILSSLTLEDSFVVLAIVSGPDVPWKITLACSPQHSAVGFTLVGHALGYVYFCHTYIHHTLPATSMASNFVLIGLITLAHSKASLHVSVDQW